MPGTVDAKIDLSHDDFFDESGKTALYAVQTIFNFAIVLLMTANSNSVQSGKKLSTFQRATQWLVIATLILCILGIFGDYNSSWLMQEICFQTLKILFIVFNYVICYQLNESLNHKKTFLKIVLAIIVCGVFLPIVLLPWDIAFRGTYPSNIVLSLYSLILLYEIKSIGAKRYKGAMGPSMQLLSMLRIELLIFVLNALILTENLIGFVNYQHPLIWGIRTCIWLLYLQKTYIVSVYFSGNGSYSSNSARSNGVNIVSRSDTTTKPNPDYDFEAGNRLLEMN